MLIGKGADVQTAEENGISLVSYLFLQSVGNRKKWRRAFASLSRMTVEC